MAEVERRKSRTRNRKRKRNWRGGEGRVAGQEREGRGGKGAEEPYEDDKRQVILVQTIRNISS